MKQAQDKPQRGQANVSTHRHRKFKPDLPSLLGLQVANQTEGKETEVHKLD